MIATIRIAASAQNSFNLVQCDTVCQELSMDNTITIGLLTFNVMFDTYGTLGKFLVAVEEYEIDIDAMHIKQPKVVITYNE